MAKQTYKKRINNKKPNNNKANWNESKKENTEKVESITYSDGITVSELAGKINKNSSDIIKLLFMLGKMMTINSPLDDENVELVCMEYGIEATKEEPKDDESLADDV